MPLGYNAKILKIDLTERTWTVEEPPESFYRNYLGGSALGLYYILKEMPSDTHPLNPDSVLTFAVSVVTGAPFSGQSRITVNAKSPLTGAIGDSQAGGFFPVEMKAAGYDAIIIKGQASSPVYVWIKDGTVEIRNAEHLWGKITGDTEDLIRQELGDEKIAVTEIGPAGENLVKLASIMNMANRACGRNGLGAVMGSKNLKAIAVRGTRRPEFADPKALRKLAAWGAEKVRTDDVMRELHTDGTGAILAALQEVGGLPTRNWRSGVFEKYEDITFETMTQNILKKRDTCYACATRCKRVVEVKNGKYKVDPRYGGPEYETVAMFGSNCGVNNLAGIAKANELCNKNGLDTIGTAATIAWAMDCFEQGLISKEDTDGLDLRFGNIDAAITLIDKIAHRRGIGQVLAQGSANAARFLHRGTENLVNAVKNAELPAHMPEVKRSLALLYAVNPFGADHQSHEHDFSYMEGASELEKKRLNILGLNNPQDALVLNEEKVRYVRVTQKVYSLADCLCLCLFCWGPAWTMYGPEHLSPMIKAVTGWDISLEELLVAGERRINMMRVFNAKEGFSRKDDILPAKVYKPKEGGPSDGYAVSYDELERAKDIYYRMAGWDVSTGNPTPEKLEQLDLGWAKDLRI